MFKITYKLDGKEVSASELGDKLAEATMDAAKDAAKEQVRAKVESIRCQVHGENAKVVFQGGFGKQFKYEIHGCCDALVADVKKALGAMIKTS